MTPSNALARRRDVLARAADGLPVWVRRAAQVAILAGAYYLTAHLSLRLALIERNVTPIWPPTGIAVVALLWVGRGAWAGIALGAFLVNLPISSPGAALATAAGNTLAPVVAAEILRWARFHPELDRLRDALAVVVAALGSMLISATIGAGTLVVFGFIEPERFLPAWAVWWTGDALGVLVVAPFLLSLRRSRPVPMDGRRRLEAAALAGTIVLVAAVVLGSSRPQLFLFLPVLGWASWRFQQAGAAPAAMVVAGLAAWSAARGIGLLGMGTLFERMLTLQAFNATVAFTSFFFAALVTERMRQRDALRALAADLEARVEARTSELRQREGQLAEAEEIARIGSWEWRVAEDRVTWSDEMYRIYGYPPQAFPLTFERAVESLFPEDAERIRENMREGLERGTPHVLPEVEYRIRRPDGAVRTLLGKARMDTDEGGSVRLVGTVQDVTETRRAEREHRIAETLQRSLLPERLPDIPGMDLAARYVPAASEVEVGGDWYDVLQLPNGNVALTIGDVAGHGLRAAATMGQLRMAVRAYALEDPSPASVLRRAHRLLQRLGLSDLVTLVHLAFEPESGRVTLASAGHPPPLVVEPEGRVREIATTLAPPLGALTDPGVIVDVIDSLAPGATLLLYTDGLIERRGESLDRGLARLREAAAAPSDDLGEVCDRLLRTLIGAESQDDVALVALRPVVLGPVLRLHLDADAASLAPLRHTVRRWLRAVGAADGEADDVVIACGEAAANAIQHAYGPGGGSFDVDLRRDGDVVTVTVRDRGSWREASPDDGGRGVDMMRALMDDLRIERLGEGTEIRMTRRLASRGSA